MTTDHTSHLAVTFKQGNEHGMESLKDLMIVELKNLAENQIPKDLPKMIKKATSTELKQGSEAIRPHFRKSRDHDIGDIEEAKPAKLSRFQSTAQAVSLSRMKKHHQYA